MFQQIEYLKEKSPILKKFFDSENRCTSYDTIIAWKAMEDLKNKKRFDANSVLQTYELAIDLDRRIVDQMVEVSWMRKNFENFPSEKMLYEYTGVDPASETYVPILIQETGLDNTSENATLRYAQDPNEIETVQLSTNVLRRPIKQTQRGFYLTLQQLEIASSRNIPLQQALATRVARDLAIAEQTFAFNNSVANSQPEVQGLFNNTAISTAVTAGVNWSSSTSGRAIVDDINKWKSAIIAATQSTFEFMPFCILVSRANLNVLQRTYSDLLGSTVLKYLTERGIRVGGMPVIPTNTAYVYYNDPMNLEISTALFLQAQPQGYEATKTAYFCPYRNVTAGLTVKRPESIYKVTGIGP